MEMFLRILTIILSSYLSFQFFVWYLAKNKRYHWYWLVIFTLGNSLITYYVTYYVNFDYLEVFLQVILYLSFCQLFSDYDFLENLFISYFAYLIQALMYYIVIINTSFETFKYVDFSRIKDLSIYPYLPLLSLVFVGAIYFLIAYFRKKYQGKLNRKMAVLLNIMVIACTLSYYPLNSLLTDASLDSGMIVLDEVCLIILMIGIVIILFGLLAEAQKNEEYRIKLTLNEYSAKKNEEIQALYNETNRLRHDLKHVLGNVIRLADEHQDEKLQDSLNQYLDKVNKTETIAIPQNQLLDYLINYYRQMAFHKGDGFTLYLNSDCKFNISDNDFSILLGNALENAVENCRGKKQITVNITDQETQTIIEIINTLDGEQVTLSKDHKSTKLSPGHGYGIDSMKEIAQRNALLLQLTSENGYFICKIIFTNSSR